MNRWLVAGGLAILLLLLWILAPAITPFAAAFVIAYVLEPAVGRLTRAGLGRALATSIVTFIAIAVIVLIIALVVPALARQVPSLIDEAVRGIEMAMAAARPLVDQVIERTGGDFGALFQLPGASDLAQRIAAWLWAALTVLAGGGLALVNLLSLLFVTPVVVFYLLRDWPKIIARIDLWLPRDHRDTVVRLAREIDERMWGFLVGQALVCLFLGVFYAVGLWLTGLRFAVLVGLLAGIVSFIPYVGVLIGAVVGLAIAFFQFTHWWQITIVAFVFMLGQFIEGNFVSPRLLGSRVGLHPVWLMFALLAGGAVYGMLGVLLAVPAAAAIGVIARFAIERYLDSAVYRGRDPR